MRITNFLCYVSINNTYMYIDRMKCSNCGKGEIVTPNPNQSIDDYLNTKKCSNCGKTGNWEMV